MTNQDPQKSVNHTHTKARELALQFLYQCECEKLFMFNSSHFENFVSYHHVHHRIADKVKSLVTGVFSDDAGIDQLISDVSKNWHLERMSVIDRSILRLATAELMQKDTPKKVVLNEAVELGKKYGTESSAAFVNGIIDAVAHRLFH